MIFINLLLESLAEEAVNKMERLTFEGNFVTSPSAKMCRADRFANMATAISAECGNG